MELKFPLLGGGVASGLNDAGIETFEGDFARNVVRECGQNSLDAAHPPGQPVELCISRVALDRTDVPFQPELKIVLQACRDHWKENEKACKFFDLAIAGIKHKTIDALKIRDSGTTGVDGTDDDMTGRWFGLVKSRGVSNQKQAGSGGAFGIGKDAPLAGSAFRTVLYSTLTQHGKVAFQGVCRLVTHKNKRGELTQGTGFIGRTDSKHPAFLALRDPNDIPTCFLRETPGLDLWILGSRHLEEEWAQPFIRSALANFWPAIHDGKIKFVIGEHNVEKSNLGEWMQKERHDTEVQKVLPYYRSLVDEYAKHFEQSLPTAGKCRLHLLLAKRELPKRICLVRQTGMVIDYYSPRVGFLPFSGLFVCEDIEGNRLLKTLEPPRHDKWDPTRAETPKARNALKEITEWIRDELKKQVPHSSEDQFNETEVPPSLFEDEPDDPLPEDARADAESDLGGNPKETSPASFVKIQTQRLRKNRNDKGKDTTDHGDDVEDPKNGDGERTGGRKRRKGEGSGSASTMPKLPNVKCRAISGPQGDEEYELILRSDGDYEGPVWVEAFGDDGSADTVQLKSADLVGTGSMEIEQSKITGVHLTEGETCRIRVRLAHPGKYSLRASIS